MSCEEIESVAEGEIVDVSTIILLVRSPEERICSVMGSTALSSAS